MKDITLEDVNHLAKLSALDFSPEEQGEFVADLNNILSMVNEIVTADVEGEVVYNRPQKIAELREDDVVQSMAQEVVLQNAPKQRQGYFNVPKVVE